MVGLYDSRYTLKSINPTASDPVADDPAMSQYTPMFVANFNDYIHKELGIRLDETYKAIQWNGLLENGIGAGSIYPQNTGLLTTWPMQCTKIKK